MTTLRYAALLAWLAVACAQNCRNGTQARARACDAVCHDGFCEIRAALILSNNTTHIMSLPRVRPVFELAEQSMRERGLFPEWLKFNLQYYDDQCDAAIALISAIDAYTDHCTHVYFGPACEYALASTARITRFLGHAGTPLVTVGGLTFDFVKPKTQCEHEFFMLARTGMVGFKDITYFIIEVMRSFNWKQLLLINEPEAQVEVAGKSSCHLMSKTFVNFLKNEKIIYSSWDTTSTGVNRNYSTNLKDHVGLKYTIYPPLKRWRLNSPIQRQMALKNIYLSLPITDGDTMNLTAPSFHRFNWTRCALLYETDGYTEVTGAGGGFLLASTISDYLIFEGKSIVGREVFASRENVFRDILLQVVGNIFSSESF